MVCFGIDVMIFFECAIWFTFKYVLNIWVIVSCLCEIEKMMYLIKIDILRLFRV